MKKIIEKIIICLPEKKIPRDLTAACEELGLKTTAVSGLTAAAKITADDAGVKAVICPNSFLAESAPVSGSVPLIVIMEQNPDPLPAGHEFKSLAGYLDLSWSRGQMKAALVTALSLGDALRTAENNFMDLKISRDRYRIVVDSAPALICRFSPDGTLTFVNDPYCRYFNMSRDQLMGYNFLNFIPEEFRADVRAKFSSLSIEKPYITYEHTVVADDGTVRWQRWTDRILTLEGKKVAEYLSLGEDITEQKQHQVSLVESEEKYRLLAENISDIIWVFDMDTMLFTYISPSVTRVLGYAPEDAVNHGIKRAFTDSSYRYLTEKIAERIISYNHGKRETYIDEVEHVHKNGTIVWCELVLTVNRNDRTGHLEAYGITRDISDRKRAEQAIRELVLERG